MSNKRSYNRQDSITMRRANVCDDQALDRLAQLEGRGLPEGPVLLAEADGKVLAALSLEDGTSIADPFAHTAHLVEMLRAQARPAANRRAEGSALGRLFAGRAPWPA